MQMSWYSCIELMNGSATSDTYKFSVGVVNVPVTISLDMSVSLDEEASCGLLNHASGCFQVGHAEVACGIISCPFLFELHPALLQPPRTKQLSSYTPFSHEGPVLKPADLSLKP